MNEATKKMVREWLEMHRGDVEGLVRWMRSQRIGGIKTCRELIKQAVV